MSQIGQKKQPLSLCLSPGFSVKTVTYGRIVVVVVCNNRVKFVGIRWHGSDKFSWSQLNTTDLWLNVSDWNTKVKGIFHSLFLIVLCISNPLYNVCWTMLLIFLKKMCSICVNLISAQQKASQLTNHKLGSMLYSLHKCWTFHNKL